MLESEKNWVHRPESAFNEPTRRMLTLLGAIFFIVVIAGIFFLKKWLEGQ